MKSVLKYKLIGTSPVIPLPEGSKPLSVSYESRSSTEPMLYIYVEGDLKRPTQPRQFRIRATEQPFQDKGNKYIATVIYPVPSVDLVWHVYEE